MDPLVPVARELARAHVRYVLIGVGGANFWARSGATIFTTEDYDLFLPADAGNELAAWRACESAGLELWCGDEPLDAPRDLQLAEQIVERRALVRADDGKGLEVDLTLVMAGFTFAKAWRGRRVFKIDGVSVPVARLLHIVQSKAAAGRPKDRLFLATHEEALRAVAPRAPRRKKNP